MIFSPVHSPLLPTAVLVYSGEQATVVQGKEVVVPAELQKILSGSRVVKMILEVCDFSREFSLPWCHVWLDF